MDPLIAAAARALAAGDVLGALNWVALREDAAALALRGIAMARLGDLERAKKLLRRAASAFGPSEAVARARCIVAEAEIALVSRDLGLPAQALKTARAALEQHGDWVNAGHARHLEARRLLLIGQLDAAEGVLAELVPSLPPALRAARELVAAGIAIRRLQASAARSSITRAGQAAREAGIPALLAEVESTAVMMATPAARLISPGGERLLLLEEVETLFTSSAVVIDACRRVVRHSGTVVSLATRPVLFALLRALGQAWPEGVPRDVLIARTFRARVADESHRARLRVEIGRLRKALRPMASVTATRQGFALAPRHPGDILVLAPAVEEEHAGVLAFLADGEAWSSSALGLALGASPRTVQRALESLLAAGKVQPLGHGRARRWVSAALPGFPAALLLPGPLPGH
jgi:DNA-binding winged helix-turn-helix (wHTH) protein